MALSWVLYTARFSEAFLTLRAVEVGLSVAYVPGLLVVSQVRPSPSIPASCVSAMAVEVGLSVAYIPGLRPSPSSPASGVSGMAMEVGLSVAYVSGLLVVS
jgi:hypothetical protein